MSEVFVKPTYDELEQALIVRDNSIAALQHQLADYEKAFDQIRQAKAEDGRLIESTQQRLAAVERERDTHYETVVICGKSIESMKAQLAIRDATIAELTRQLEHIRFELGLTGVESRPLGCYVADLKATITRLIEERDFARQQADHYRLAPHQRQS